EEHLASCASCRAYASEMELIAPRLQNEFQARWDGAPGPSQKVIEHVTTKARMIPMANRVSAGLKLFGGIAALIAMALFINLVFSQLQNTSSPATETKTVDNSQLPENRLIAFTSPQDGTLDIYTIHANGSGATDLTNNAATDRNPVWSPDGQRIAFESDRNGNFDVYTMDADGSNLVQVTTDPSSDVLAAAYDSPWSPDGKQIVIQSNRSGQEALYVVPADGNGEAVKISDTSGVVIWSPAGDRVAYSYTSGQGGAYNNPENDALRVVNTNGSNRRDLVQGSLIWDVHWAPEGKTLFYREGETTLDIQRVDPENGTAETVLNVDSFGMGMAWFSPDATIVYQSSEPPPGLATSLYRLEAGKSSLVGELNAKEACGARTDSPYGPAVFVSHDTNQALYHERCGSEQAIFTLLDLRNNTSVILGKLPLLAISEINAYWSQDDQVIAIRVVQSDGSQNSDAQASLYVFDRTELSQPPAELVPVLEQINGLTRIAVQPRPEIEVTHLPTPAPTQIASPNGLIAFMSTQNGNSDIYTMHPDGSDLTNLTDNPTNDFSPFWSPDGKRIAFESDRDGSTQIYLMDADGSNIIQLTSGEGDDHFDNNGYTPWSPDGRKLIFSRRASGADNVNLNVIDITNKSITTLTNKPGQYLLPSWAQDGRHIAFVSDTGRAAWDLFVVGSDGSHLTKLTENLSGGEFFTFGDYYWSPDGAFISFATQESLSKYQSTVYKAGWDGSLTVIARMKKPIIDWWDGTALQLGEGPLSWVRSDGSQSTLDLCDSNSQIRGIAHKRSSRGNLIFGWDCIGSGWTFYLTNPNGTMINQLAIPSIPAEQDSVANITWSPDEQYIAFVGIDSASPDLTAMLYVLNVAKAREDPSIQPVKMINSSSLSWQPASDDKIIEVEPTPEPTQISSFNGLIAFTSTQNGNPEIYTMRADGSELTNLTNNPAEDVSPVWSPDGKRIAFVSIRDGNQDVYVMNADGSDLTRMTNDPAPDTVPVWSPDGTKIAYSSGDFSEKHTNIYVVNSNGQNRRQLTNYDSGTLIWSVLWSPDNQSILVNVDSQIVEIDVNGGEITPVTPKTKTNTGSYALAKDGSTFSYLTECNESNSIICYRLRSIRRDGTEQDFTKWLATLKTPEVCPIKKTATWMGSYIKWSPDQTKILFIFTCEEDGWIYIANADGSDFKPLTNHPILGNGPDKEVATGDWSPDSQSIVFMSALNNAQHYNLYSLNVTEALKNPTLRPTPLNISASQISSPAWQPTP
ncbi:MAG TPA: hypothetical protein VK249_21080, partial [Anaerolineales bacterium]|nr:hypothetical protein [Anaerolineales bacterium]